MALADYGIVLTRGGEYGVKGQTERAENRTPGGLKIGHTIVFKDRAEILEYVRVAEEAGFSFDGKDLILPH